ncbi:hypothetical protein [Portibacter marinus]|uniref:hypothetical protein n=1 Tax=Portibacter marinus TaxID=2898660 RepID=UPI001F2A4117|nr:hypothetical protein [Portibacter marinus]
MRLLHILLILLLCLGSCQQFRGSRDADGGKELETFPFQAKKNTTSSSISELGRFLYTDSVYTFAEGQKLMIQNSLPKGGVIAPDGSQYDDSKGRSFAFAVFWTRVVNEGHQILEIDMSFPSDSFAIFRDNDSFLKLFLPEDSLHVEFLSEFNYGLRDLKTYLDSNFNKSTKMFKRLYPGEEHMFYIATLAYRASGTPRAALFLKGNSIYYKMSLSELENGIVPCGQISFKHEGF